METGFLLINKEADWTSHDVVGYLRKITRIKKIGHAGTLDPFATGLLIVGIGRECTKRLDEFKGMPKTYIATLHLGATSDTFDKTGVIALSQDTVIARSEATKQSLTEILDSFIGTQDQIPPMYSAKKIDGQRLYTLARQGIEVERKPNQITIYNIKLLEYDFPLIKIEVQCSTGTYVRSLVHDIGQKIGIGAYCEALERTDIGSYSIKNAHGVKDLSKDTWQDHLI
jgi:tRNA pseudouridine(55) synthase